MGPAGHGEAEAALGTEPCAGCRPGPSALGCRQGYRLRAGLARFRPRPRCTGLLVVDQPAARSVNFVLVAGREDPRYLSQAKRFAAQLDGLRVRHRLFELPGGHDGGVWRSGLVVGLKEVKPQLEEVIA